MRIGVFDSGVGGITVLAELRKRLAGAEYLYLGDTANVPYGTKSAAQIEHLSRECARRLRALEVDALVVACNTASAHALEAVREEMGTVPVVGVVQPGVQAVLRTLEQDGGSLGESMTTTILVLATSATVRSQAYSRTLREALTADRPGRLPLPIIEQACPLLVPMIEEGWVEHPILKQTLNEYLGRHVRGSEPGVALLGCTHYPWIQAAIEQALPGWKVINSAQAVAEAVAAGLGARAGSPRAGRVEWIFTDPQAVPEFARRWMETVAP